MYLLSLLSGIIFSDIYYHYDGRMEFSLDEIIWIRKEKKRKKEMKKPMMFHWITKT